MKTVKSLLVRVLLVFPPILYAQTNTFPDNGNVGIGTTSPDSKLHLYIPSGTAAYPTGTSKGDVLQSIGSSNNGLEIGNSRGFNDRKAWILARHNSVNSYGTVYSVFHLQPDIGDKTYYKGVGIGYSASEDLPIGTHLAVNGKVGIGTTSPDSKLHLYIPSGTAAYPTGTSKGDVLQSIGSSNNGLEIGNSRGFNDRKAWILARHSSVNSYGTVYSVFHLQPDIGDKTYYKGVGIGYGASQDLPVGTHLAVNGKVGIGTTNPGSYKLAVNGNIRAKEIKVETGWADYVFKKGYDLPTLSAVERHIKEKGHLINIPSAKEVEENGIQLGEMNKLLLEKIEELTLYTIQQQKEINSYQKNIGQLAEKLEALQQQINNLKN